MNMTMLHELPAVATGSAGKPSRRSRTAQVVCGVSFVVLLFGGAVALAGWSEKIPGTGHLLRDPTAVAHAPWWFGVVSRLVNLAWAVTATICVLAAFADRAQLRRPLLLLGALVAMLTLDDTLLLHDAILLGRGIAEGLVMSIYAVSGLVLARLWWPHRRTDAGVAFFLGAGCLAVSVALDAVFGDLYVAEDAAKTLGILAWGFCAAWSFSSALSRLSGGVANRASRAGRPEPGQASQ